MRELEILVDGHLPPKSREGKGCCEQELLEQVHAQGARYYSSDMGRFMTPDWAARPTTVPYANFGDPQSLNLYSYVRNNPVTSTDPDGHQDTIQGNATTSTGGCGIPTQPCPTEAAARGSESVRNASTSTELQNPGHQSAQQKTGNPFLKFDLGHDIEQFGATHPKTANTVDNTIALVGLTALTGGASDILEGGGVATTLVTHFTSDEGVEAITESGFLNAGTYVTTPGSIPESATAGDIESLLEVSPGKGANSISFEIPTSNLKIPEGGPTTSGGAVQFQIRVPTRIDSSLFKVTVSPE